MDSVTGSRKYFQNLADNNYYRNSMNRSFFQANYSSYQNTLGRNSVGPFAQTTCSIPYQNDASLHSQYGYNSWGMWKDSRNLTPSSTYSSKSNRRSVRSFTILLMTAVFIVMIAIFGFAALAFYFSTYKADTNDLMLFDGKFLVLKGDTFTTGLKYNHTSAFQQKAELYQGLITKSLEKNGIEPIKCTITSFGNGPLITLMFRLIVDMRKIPLTVKSVEDHIKESISKEASFKKSIFNNISIDVDSINIQRILDHEDLKSASFINVETTTPPSEHFGNTRAVEKHFTKPTTTVKSSGPTKVGPSDMPIQGSFEVTKTDADIAQKKSSPTTSKTSTLRPFTISNTGMRIKTKKTTIEKVKNPTIPSTGISHVNKVTIQSQNGTDMRNGQDNLLKTSTTVKPPPEITTTTSEMATVSNVTTPSNTTTLSTEASPKTIRTTTESSQLVQNTFQRRTDITVSKLDANLFTTAPIIDDEPWLPINPISPQGNFDTVITKVVNVEAADDSNGNGQINILPRNKIRFSEPFDDTFNREMLFHSFTNPAYTYLTPGIETLGSANLRPYPIPVNKIGDEPESTESVTPLLSQILKNEEPSVNLKNEDKDASTESATRTHNSTNQTGQVTEPTILIGDVLLDLLGGKTDNEKEYRPVTTTTRTTTTTTTSATTLPETTTTINFKNIKEFILLNAKNNNSSNANQDAEGTSSNKVNVTKNLSPLSTSTLRNFAENATLSAKPTSYVEVETVQYTPVSESWNQPSLFPVQSKFEYVNGTLMSSFDTQAIRRIFNETLHAWIIENSQKDKVNENDEIFARKNSSHIQNISAIFDTLASELGIQPNISTKSPPFKTTGQNKLKTSIYADIRNQPVRNKTVAGKPALSTTTLTTTSTTTMRTSTDYYPLIKTDDMYGEAEIEEVDPTQYEQILRGNNRGVSSTTVPSLITLMPVKSNSGIRQRRPTIEKLKMAIKNSRGIA